MTTPDPNWFGEFWAVNHRWPTDEEILDQLNAVIQGWGKPRPGPEGPSSKPLRWFE